MSKIKLTYTSQSEKIMSATQSEVNFIHKYNRSGPRYTSYPTAMELSEGINDSDLFDAVQNSRYNQLSLYFHIPFCNQLCYYCACNKMVTRQRDKVERYLQYLHKEIVHRAPHFMNKEVCQIHFGGGTPNFLRPEQLATLLDEVSRHYSISPNAEISIEIDPRIVEKGDIQAIRDMGFNRISIGIQDFDKEVQVAINREQSFKQVRDVMLDIREAHFDSVNMDLIYGLPYQSLQTAMHTLHCIQALQPDRVSLFNYAHMPDRFAAQRKIKEHWLPTAGDKAEMHKFAKARLLTMGYQHIGMDHFAKPNDSLSIAQKENRLHRNFQGYTELSDADLLGFGITSISQVGNVITQNHKTLNAYYQAIDQINDQVNDQLGDQIKSGTACSIVERGIRLTRDDLIRAAVIKQLICHCNLDIQKTEKEFGILFLDYFADELEMLIPMVEDGLIKIDENGIQVVEQGRQFVRTICMCFDKYLPKYQRSVTFSKVI